MWKKQKDIKGLKFGYRQNSINYAISTGVTDYFSKFDFLDNVLNFKIPQNSMQYDVVVESDEEAESTAETEHQDDDSNVGDYEIAEADEGDI